MPTTVETLRNVSTVVPSSAPANVSLTIQPLGDRLRVTIVYEDDQWVAVEGYTGMFGEGDTKGEAVADLGRGLVGLREELAMHREDLTERLQDQFAALEAVIGPAE